MTEFLVLKLNMDRQETWRYSGRLLERGSNSVLIEALFNRDDMPFFEIILGRGDRFVEKFYSDRWYNIFEIHDREDDRIKGWYCNVCLPAEIGPEQISYVDLALDLLVYPDGRQVVLDEDEFEALRLDESLRQNCLRALAELQNILKEPQEFQAAKNKEE